MNEQAPQQNTEDLAAMQEMLVAMAEEKGAKEVIELLIGLLAQARTSNTQLKSRLEQALRQLYGRKSEKINPAQLSLLLQGLGGNLPEGAQNTTTETSGDGTVPQPKNPPKKLGGHKPRRELPTNLPREPKLIPVPVSERMCVECGIEKVCIGHEKSEVLEFVPAHFKIIEQSREKLACPKCESGVVTAPSGKVMERGRPGPGLLANILVEKGQDGMPLYRQAQGYKRVGVSLPESTLGDWFGFGCDVMIPLAERLSALMVASNYVSGDDTGIKVLDRDHVNGVKRGHMWGFVSGNMVVFRYAPDWTSEHPSEFLRGFLGHLQGDGYAGFDKVLEPPEGGATNVSEERRLGCGMHIRRKFEEAAKLGDARGAIALSFFSKLYRIEAECKKEGLAPEARFARRQAESIPVVDDLYRWIRGLHPTVVPGTPIYKAVGYAINQEAYWRRCFSDGRFEIDNGEVERQLRRVALGRKNYLFAGSDAGAKRLAVAYTVLGSCHMNDVNPLAYLTDVIEKLQNGWPKSRLDELLPHRWRPNLSR